MTRLFRRRDVLATAAAGAMLPLLPAYATPDSVAAAIKEIVGDAPLKPGKVKLDLPPLAENGNAVSVSVTVDNPMTEQNHVRSIHLFAESNPLPNVVHVTLGPRAGRAFFATRMRLSTTQKVIAIAKLSDGTCWTDSAQVVVTLAACVEDL
jgi:sulfur-oxidizing protein SoxY